MAITFKEIWQKEFKWLKPVINDSRRGFCDICRCELMINYSGYHVLVNHAKCKKHKKNKWRILHSERRRTFQRIPDTVHISQVNESLMIEEGFANPRVLISAIPLNSYIAGAGLQRLKNEAYERFSRNEVDSNYSGNPPNSISSQLIMSPGSRRESRCSSPGVNICINNGEGMDSESDSGLSGISNNAHDRNLTGQTTSHGAFNQSLIVSRDNESAGGEKVFANSPVLITVRPRDSKSAESEKTERKETDENCSSNEDTTSNILLKILPSGNDVNDSREPSDSITNQLDLSPDSRCAPHCSSAREKFRSNNEEFGTHTESDLGLPDLSNNTHDRKLPASRDAFDQSLDSLSSEKEDLDDSDQSSDYYHAHLLGLEGCFLASEHSMKIAEKMRGMTNESGNTETVYEGPMTPSGVSTNVKNSLADKSPETSYSSPIVAHGSSQNFEVRETSDDSETYSETSIGDETLDDSQFPENTVTNDSASESDISDNDETSDDPQKEECAMLIDLPPRDLSTEVNLDTQSERPQHSQLQECLEGGLSNSVNSGVSTLVNTELFMKTVSEDSSKTNCSYASEVPKSCRITPQPQSSSDVLSQKSNLAVSVNHYICRLEEAKRAYEQKCDAIVKEFEIYFADEMARQSANGCRYNALDGTMTPKHAYSWGVMKLLAMMLEKERDGDTVSVDTQDAKLGHASCSERTFPAQSCSNQVTEAVEDSTHSSSSNVDMEGNTSYKYRSRSKRGNLQSKSCDETRPVKRLKKNTFLGQREARKRQPTRRRIIQNHEKVTQKI